MPRAFVTGATGQDGSYLLEQLHGLGWDLHALVRAAVDEQEQTVPEWAAQHIGDLTDAEGLSGIITAVEPDVVFNLGGITSVALSWEQPELVARATGLAVSTLLDSAWTLQQRTGKQVRVIQPTSAEIFGAATQVPQNEQTRVRPTTPYGAAKAYAHHLVGVYRDRGLFASSGILYNHESPRRPTAFVTRKITSEVARIARGRSDALVLGNLDAERDWGWAPDYVDGLVRIAQADQPDDFVIATGVSHTVRDFVAAAFAAAGIPDWEHFIRVDERFLRPTDAPTMRGDASRAREVLGWTPTMPFEGVVAAMVEHDLDLIDD